MSTAPRPPVDQSANDLENKCRVLFMRSVWREICDDLTQWWKPQKNFSITDKPTSSDNEQHVMWRAYQRYTTKTGTSTSPTPPPLNAAPWYVVQACLDRPRQTETVLNQHVLLETAELEWCSHVARRVTCVKFAPQFRALVAKFSLLHMHSINDEIGDTNTSVHMPTQPTEPQYVLGDGVMLAVCQRSRGQCQPVAVRCLMRSQTSNMCVRRLKLLARSLDEGVHLLNYRHVVMTEHQWLLVRDVCDWNLKQFLDEQSSIGIVSQETLIPLTVQLLSGLSYLHGRDPHVFHGNLKPSNVLVDARQVLRLVDFGLGKLNPVKNDYTGECCIDDDLTLHPVCWKPPEFYAHSVAYTWRSDIHTAGMLIGYILTTGKYHPYIGRIRKDFNAHILRERVRSGSIMLHLCSSLTPCQQDLIVVCLQRNAEHRPSASSLLRHHTFWSSRRRLGFLLALFADLSEHTVELASILYDVHASPMDTQTQLRVPYSISELLSTLVTADKLTMSHMRAVHIIAVFGNLYTTGKLDHCSLLGAINEVHMNCPQLITRIMNALRLHGVAEILVNVEPYLAFESKTIAQ